MLKKLFYRWNSNTSKTCEREREREREREKEGEIFHNKASSIGNRPDIEFPVKVGLHLFIIKNIWNNRASLLDMMNCKGRGLKKKEGNVYK